MRSALYPIIGLVSGFIMGGTFGCSFGLITTFTKAIKRTIIFSILGGGIGLGLGSYVMIKN